MKFLGKILSCVIDFFISLVCPTWGCTKKELDKMMIKKGYRRGYGVWIMPDDIILDEEYRA